MDTLDRLIPREAETAADRDLSVNRDAEFNPDAVVDDPGGKGSATYLDGGEEIESTPKLTPWQIAGMVAGGVAVVAGLTGVAYWRMRQMQKLEVQKPKTLLSRIGVAKIDLSKAHPRQLSRLAGRRIEQLPVRDVQKRIADGVSHLFG